MTRNRRTVVALAVLTVVIVLGVVLVRRRADARRVQRPVSGGRGDGAVVATRGSVARGDRTGSDRSAVRLTRWDLAALVSAAAVAVGVVIVAGPTLTTDATAASAPMDISRQQVAEYDRPSVLFIGDSYTAGNGLAEMSYACTTAVEMDWLCILSAVPGTGYISGGPANRFVVDEYSGRSTSFTERIPRLATVHDPDVVVLDGGRNDLFPPSEDVYREMVATIEDARRTWPEAAVVFVRPRLLTDPADNLGFDDAFVARLAAEPSTQGVLFVDPIASMIGSDTSELLAEDRKHPNALGSQAIGAALTESLEPLERQVRS
ncbi:SGNH/GDSL hydrolase family protein [Rhodococcus sp. O3]|uniref:SGNH/GDSL hydrolase family protein n=1 Tax=Rhodococcus sp. O3 TaxID=3404919 RepID=UPI003B681695